MKFIYKIPHGYFSGGAYFKYATTVNSSAWSDNNLLICLEPNGEKIYSRQAQKRAGQADTPTIQERHRSAVPALQRILADAWGLL